MRWESELRFAHTRTAHSLKRRRRRQRRCEYLWPFSVDEITAQSHVLVLVVHRFCDIFFFLRLFGARKTKPNCSQNKNWMERRTRWSCSIHRFGRKWNFASRRLIGTINCRWRISPIRLFLWWRAPRFYSVRFLEYFIDFGANLNIVVAHNTHCSQLDSIFDSRRFSFRFQLYHKSCLVEYDIILTLTADKCI